MRSPSFRYLCPDILVHFTHYLPFTLGGCQLSYTLVVTKDIALQLALLQCMTRGNYLLNHSTSMMDSQCATKQNLRLITSPLTPFNVYISLDNYDLHCCEKSNVKFRLLVTLETDIGDRCHCRKRHQFSYALDLK